MTPAARVAAAIEVLDRILSGDPAEKALTNWARAHRFAGSKDRAAIRDHVFDALRRRRSAGAAGGSDSGRGLMIGVLRLAGEDPRNVFTGEGYAPPPLTHTEAAHEVERRTLPDAVRLDIPDWLEVPLREALGAEFEPVLRTLGSRAPVFVRVNAARSDLDGVAASLAAEGIEAAASPIASTALEIRSNHRRLRQSEAYREGWLELQDAASQAVIEALGPLRGLEVLDYCAGGGGKALAMAAQGADVAAHDVDPRRMRDIPERARRAGVSIPVLSGPQRMWDLVLVDAPCSGSGAWRRQPDAKWSLTPARLDRLVRMQAEILDRAADHVAPEGRLAYVTCSVLGAENQGQTEAFLARRPGWSLAQARHFLPSRQGDGFFVAILQRETS